MPANSAPTVPRTKAQLDGWTKVHMAEPMLKQHFSRTRIRHDDALGAADSESIFMYHVRIEKLQSNLVISNSLISNYRLSRSEIWSLF